MIRLDKVTKTYRTRTSRKVILDNISCDFPADRNVGILGVNGAGKSTMLRLLSGSELPDKGRVLRHCRVSFPLAFDGAVHPQLTGRENVKFVASIYGHNPKTVIEYVQEFAGLDNYFDMPTDTYSSGMRARLSFGLCLAINFDVYLVDEVTAVGDIRFQAKCHAAFQERTRHSSVIMVSHSFDTIRAYCNTGAILDNGNLTFYDSVDDAIEIYRKMIGTSLAATG
ncbi:MAG: ABC transporter ATP-binding protein [Alphaproteobacteria bacterium]|nr:ABC transporter ATP-binding protein [Alphaproteobacteria bacterium]